MQRKQLAEMAQNATSCTSVHPRNGREGPLGTNLSHAFDHKCRPWSVLHHRLNTSAQYWTVLIHYIPCVRSNQRAKAQLFKTGRAMETDSKKSRCNFFARTLQIRTGRQLWSNRSEGRSESKPDLRFRVDSEDR